MSVDQREKAITCREIASLEEFVLVAQKPVSIVLCRRTDCRSPITLNSLQAVLELRSAGLTVPIGQVCEGVR